MIECTLQEAVERCEKDGGKFYIKNENANTMGYHIGYAGVIRDQDGEPFNLEIEDFREKWVYEPPPSKSAFKLSCEECIKDNVSKCPCSLLWGDIKDAHKIGWNGFGDALGKILKKITDIPDIVFEKIDELKEK